MSSFTTQFSLHFFSYWMQIFGGFFSCFFRCAVASLYEVVSVRPSVGPFVGPSVCPVLFSKVNSTHTRRNLCRVSGLVFIFNYSSYSIKGYPKKYFFINILGNQKKLQGLFGTHIIFPKQMPTIILNENHFVLCDMSYDFVKLNFFNPQSFSHAADPE